MRASAFTERPGFVSGVGVAFVLALAGAAACAGLSVVLPIEVAFRITLTLLAGAYVIYLLRVTAEPSGRVVVPVLWGLAALALWWVPGLLLFVCGHVGLIWLVRSLYHHDGVLVALADLALSGLALGAAIWAADSDSMFLTFWSFFLVQALFVWLPTTSRGADAALPSSTTSTSDQAFTHAKDLAEQSLKRLVS